MTEDMQKENIVFEAQSYLRTQSENMQENKLNRVNACKCIVSKVAEDVDKDEEILR